MIVDAFMVRDELDLTVARLVEHDDLVDRFVIVEGERRFGDGARKPLYVADHWSLLEPWADRIVHVVVRFDEFPDGDAWAREHYQRSRLADGFTDLDDGDVVAIGDVDEFPDRTQWHTRGTVAWMRHMVYAPNLEHPVAEPGTVIDTAGRMPRPDVARNNRASFERHVAGFHFSWHPGFAPLWDKAAATSHTEFADVDPNHGKTIRRSHWDNMPLRLVDVDATWPRWFRTECPDWWWAT